MNAFTKNKQVCYCYPTSDKAKELGYYKDGCYYVMLDGQILHSSGNLTTCVNFAKTLPNQWNKYFAFYKKAWI